MAGQDQLHDIGGVGAQHHQFAVRHVDDPHHAERDGKPDRGQHQHRSQAQAEEQGLDAAVEAAPAVDVRDGLRGRAAYRRVGVT